MFGDLKNSSVLVTGATGLIGQALVKKLLSVGAKVVVVARNKEKANRLFGKNDEISYVCIIILVVCIIIDLIRQKTIGKLEDKLLGRWIEKVDSKLRNYLS